jgi:TRAP transporter TAXI family solute receptor
MASETPTPGILETKLKMTRRRLRSLWLKMWGGGIVLVLVAFGVAWLFVEPAPPDRIVIAAGPDDGAYYQFAQEYAKFFRKHGIQLEVRETAGSLENYELLKSDPEVNLAIVQGGTAPEGIEYQAGLEALGSLYLEPVWVFYRSDEELSDLRDLEGLTVSIGEQGSGIQALATRLLHLSGVKEEDGTKKLSLSNTEAARRLQAGEIDAIFLVGQPRSQAVHDLLRSDGVKLMSFARHGAWARYFTYLSDVKLYRGVIDLELDIPQRDVDLIAPAANLVATAELHQAFVPLLLEAASESHGKGSPIVSDIKFPNLNLIEFPANRMARNFFESGPPVLQKHLPFWVASFIDRGKILLIPILTLLFPLFKIAPPLYRWRIRSRIYRWYRLLREIEGDLKDAPSRETLEHHQAAIQEMHDELDELTSVPLSYMEEFYNLRLHVEYVGRRVEKAVADDSQNA